MGIVTDFIPGSHLLTTGELSDLWGGWLDLQTWLTVTFAYGSADSPTFVMTSDVDLTGILQPGQRVRLTQTTTKYFIVVAVGAYAAGTMNITLLAPNDGTALANATITACSFSPHKAPFGFPCDPTKWFWQTKNTSDKSQASPTSGSWYAFSGVSLNVPLGAWRLSYSAYVIVTGTGTYLKSSLSTASGSESDNEFTRFSFTGDYNAVASKPVALSGKTPYYIVAATDYNTSVGLDGSSAFPSIIRADCAYL